MSRLDAIEDVNTKILRNQLQMQEDFVKVMFLQVVVVFLFEKILYAAFRLEKSAESAQKVTLATFYVTDQPTGSLLSYETSMELGILQLKLNTVSDTSNAPDLLTATGWTGSNSTSSLSDMQENPFSFTQAIRCLARRLRNQRYH